MATAATATATATEARSPRAIWPSPSSARSPRCLPTAAASATSCSSAAELSAPPPQPPRPHRERPARRARAHAVARASGRRPETATAATSTAPRSPCSSATAAAASRRSIAPRTITATAATAWRTNPSTSRARDPTRAPSASRTLLTSPRSTWEGKIEEEAPPSRLALSSDAASALSNRAADDRMSAPASGHSNIRGARGLRALGRGGGQRAVCCVLRVAVRACAGMLVRVCLLGAERTNEISRQPSSAVKNVFPPRFPRHPTTDRPLRFPTRHPPLPTHPPPRARWPGTTKSWLAGLFPWVLVWAGACYWHGVGGSVFNSPSSSSSTRRR